MRWAVLVVVLALTGRGVARGDGESFGSLAALCASRGSGRCLVLERAHDYAAVVVETKYTYTYAIAVNDDGWRWVDDASLAIDLDLGSAFLSSNCCEGTNGRPHYAFAVHDRIAILKVDVPLRQFTKPGFLEAGTTEDRTGLWGAWFHHTDGVACRRTDPGVRCKQLRFANCSAPSAVSVEGLAVTTDCRPCPTRGACTVREDLQ